MRSKLTKNHTDMTEYEKNSIVLDELFKGREFSDEIKELRTVDWDKAFTSIFYLKKSDALKAKGEQVYEHIRNSCTSFLESFKEAIEKYD